MKILFVLDNYYPHVGGAEILFQNLCEDLVRHKHKITVITCGLKGSPTFEEKNGVIIHRVHSFYNRYLFTFMSTPLVLKLARENDLIHTTTFNSAFPAWLAAKIHNRKVIITILEVWIGKWKTLGNMSNIKAYIHNLLESFIYLFHYDLYACISRSTQRDLINKIHIPIKKTFIAYPGIDYVHWDPTKYNSDEIRNKLKLDNTFAYFFSGRPGISKGLEYLIRAVPLIIQEIPDSKLIILMSRDSDYALRYTYIMNLIQELKVGDYIQVYDSVPYKELPKYIKAVDCVVIPSLAEGFGIFAVEACAMSKPIVVSNTTSLPEVISGKYILVECANSVSIAKGVIDVYNKKYIESPIKKFLYSEQTKVYENEYKNLVN